MEALMSQFTSLADRALQDRNFNPAEIKDLMRLFEVEACKLWAAAELEGRGMENKAEAALEEVEAALDSAMGRAMDEFLRFEVEANRMSKEEQGKLVATAERARTMGHLMQKAASPASKKYVKAAINSATVSMRSASKGLPSKKVHPS